MITFRQQDLGSFVNNHIIQQVIVWYRHPQGVRRTQDDGISFKEGVKAFLEIFFGKIGRWQGLIGLVQLGVKQGF